MEGITPDGLVAIHCQKGKAGVLEGVLEVPVGTEEQDGFAASGQSAALRQILSYAPRTRAGGREDVQHVPMWACGAGIRQ